MALSMPGNFQKTTAIILRGFKCVLLAVVPWADSHACVPRGFKGEWRGEKR